MLGLLVELIASWLILWFVERKDLFVLGITLTKTRIRNLIFGIVVSSITCAVYYLAIGYSTAGTWIINKDFSSLLFVNGLWWTLKSVLFEELIFRGALLYVLVQRVGVKTACITSAICFGIYHWFSYNAFGNVVQMLMIFIMTGVAGLMFAYAFAISKTLYLPIGLHFGWNFVSAIIFSNGPLGKQLLVLEGSGPASDISSTLLTLFQVLALPLIVAWYLKKIWKEQSPA